MVVHFTYMEDKTLNENIVELTHTIKRVSSYKFVFLRGIINGVGTFIGATIVAAVVITFAIQVLGFFGLEGYFEQLLPKE